MKKYCLECPHCGQRKSIIINLADPQSPKCEECGNYIDLEKMEVALIEAYLGRPSQITSGWGEYLKDFKKGEDGEKKS